MIGEVTDGERLVIDWHGETVVDVPPRTVAHEGPVYERPFARPDWQDHVQADGVRRPCPGLTTGDELRETLLRLVGSPNLCDKSWVTDQYDRYVRGNSVLAQPEDAGMLRIDERPASASRWPPTAMAGSPTSIRTPARSSLWPRPTATLPRAGAMPLAITDCLNFGSPEDPAVMWQFTEAIARPRGRLPRARHPGHRRQCQLLQPDRQYRDPADAGGRRARRDRRCDARTRPVSRPRATSSSCSARPVMSWPVRLGPTSYMIISAATRRQSIFAHEQPLAEVLITPSIAGCWPAHTTLPRAVWRRRWWNHPFGMVSARDRAAFGRRSICRAVLRERWSRTGLAVRGPDRGAGGTGT